MDLISSLHRNVISLLGLVPLLVNSEGLYGASSAVGNLKLGTLEQQSSTGNTMAIRIVPLTEADIPGAVTAIQ